MKLLAEKINNLKSVISSDNKILIDEIESEFMMGLNHKQGAVQVETFL